jgi:hypothetical protein
MSPGNRSANDTRDSIRFAELEPGIEGKKGKSPKQVPNVLSVGSIR